jgi:hypothetical protein
LYFSQAARVLHMEEDTLIGFLKPKLLALKNSGKIVEHFILQWQHI